MSWYKTAAGRNPFCVGILIGLLCLPVGGCLQPLYGGVNDRLSEELRAISIDPIPDRIGHYLANELAFAFNGTGSDVHPKYNLHVSLSQKAQTPLVDTFAGRASAATLYVEAAYKLVTVDTGQLIAEGVASNLASYDRTAQRFANLRAARDAEIRNAKALADQIRLRISVALTKSR